MHQSPPNKLDSQAPQRDPLNSTLFMVGFFIGVAISIWLWVVQWNKWGQSNCLYGILFLKLLIATLLYQTKFRAAGIGIWCSVAIGALLWIGMCATHVSV